MRPLGRRILCCVASLLVSSLESAWASSQAAGGGVGGAFRLPSAIVGIEASVEQMEKLYLAQGAYKEAAKYEKLRKNLDELRLLPSSDGSVKGQLENEVASQLINLQRELIVDHATVTAVRQQNEGGDVAFVKLAEQTEKMTQVNGLAARMYKGVYYILWAVGLMSLGTALVLFGDSAVQHLGNTKEVDVAEDPEDETSSILGDASRPPQVFVSELAGRTSPDAIMVDLSLEDLAVENPEQPGKQSVGSPTDPPGFSTLDLGTPQKRHRRLDLTGHIDSVDDDPDTGPTVSC